MGPHRDRLKMVVLYFLCSVIVGKDKTGKGALPVESFFLKAAGDLDLCKTFPRGRFAFHKNMEDIRHSLQHFKRTKSDSLVFPSFVLSLQLLAFEAIPELKNKNRENFIAPHIDCPRICKQKFIKISMTGFPLSEINDTLGKAEIIHSIMIPSKDEEDLLSRIMDENDNDLDDADDVVVDGWKILLTENRSIFFKKFYDADVAARGLDGVRQAAITKREATSKKKLTNVASTSVSFDVMEEVKSLKTMVEEMKEKYEDVNTRLKMIEEERKIEEEEKNEKEVDDSQTLEGFVKKRKMKQGRNTSVVTRQTKQKKT